MILTAAFLTVSAQSVVSSNYEKISTESSTLAFLPLSQVKEGMRGKAKTVFRGTEPEEFDVEILGVLPNAIGPNQDLIIGKISGSQVEKTAVFAGMSGSPVFVDGKLIGAISYSFPFSKEPICGITPIEQMIGIFSDTEKTRPMQVKKVFSESEIHGTARQFSISTDTQKANIFEQAFQPIATPVAFSGFTPQTLELFSSQLKALGLLPVSSVGGSSKNRVFKKYDEKTLQPGSSVAMELTRGDYSITAYGTVTFRDGENVYAFGHPFLNLGVSNLPMSESKVVAIVPSIYNSFKLAVSDATVGTMTQDRNTGVLGKLGQEPKMIPVEISLKTSRGKNEKVYFEIVEDSFLTPLLLNITIYNAIVSNERMLGEATIEFSGDINIQGQSPVKLERKLTGSNAAIFTANSVAAPVSLLLQSGFEPKIDSIKLQLSFTDGERSATIERISLNRTELKPGETLEIQAFLRTSDGKQLNKKLVLDIPKDLASGKYNLLVGDGNSAQQVLPENLFVPKNLSELIEKLNKTKSTDKIYVLLTKQSDGAIIGIKELPNLPPSVLATLGNSRSNGQATPATLSILLEKESEKLEYTISGQKSFVISIKN
jgi:hypothetical protein